MELDTCIFYIIDGRLIFTLKPFRGDFSNLMERINMRREKRRAAKKKFVVVQ